MENVIAGVSLISDKAIRVGDVLKVGETVGTVSDIGLRSTRIRTLDRRVVNVPNGQIANATLENLSLRDQFWLYHMLGLTYQTTASQMRWILEGLTKLLVQRPNVDESSVRVRFLRLGASSLDVEVFAYLSARDWSQAAGARIALPSTTMYLATSAANGSDAASRDTHVPRSASTAADRAAGAS